MNRALDKRGVVAFDRASAASRNEAVATTIGASLALLEDADRKRATELAIYVEPKSVPLSAASALWGLDGFDTEELVQRLDDVRWWSSTSKPARCACTMCCVPTCTRKCRIQRRCIAG